MRLCSLASGSSGNSIYIGNANTHLLVDVGISKKKIDEGLHSIDVTGNELDGILITHEHSDHIGGLGVMSRKYGVPIYATENTINAIKEKGCLGKIDASLFRVISPDNAFAVGDIEVRPFRTSHDAADPVAYTFKDGNKQMAVCTDLGKFDEYIIDKIKNMDVLLLEANHDIRMLQVGSYPYYLKQRILGDFGHLSNENAGRLLSRVLHDKCKQIILGHLSLENNYPDLAYETVKAEITLSDSEYNGNDFPITVAKRDEVSSLIEI